jgi:SAM-dependent methyltransferase
VLSDPPGFGDPSDPSGATLAAYHAAAERYLQESTGPAPSVLAYLDQIAELAGEGHVLELGSGPGWDAGYLESRGVRVTRSDATPHFVGLLRDAGHDALLMDVRSDDFGGPYDGVLADAVLHHLTRPQFEAALRRCRAAVGDGGILGCTTKEGDGAGWTQEKIGLPRYFTYWREAPLREALARAGWTVVWLERPVRRNVPWLHVIASAGGG